MQFDDLLTTSVPSCSPPHAFGEHLEERIQECMLRRKRWALLRDTVLFGGAFAFLSYALSLLFTSALAFQTADFFSALLIQPSIILVQEGRMALLEAIPLMSLLLSGIAVLLCLWFFRLFLRDVSPFFHFSHHVFSF